MRRQREALCSEQIETEQAVERKKKSFSKSSDSTIEEQRNVQEWTYFRS